MWNPGRKLCQIVISVYVYQSKRCKRCELAVTLTSLTDLAFSATATLLARSTALTSLTEGQKRATPGGCEDSHGQLISQLKC